MGDHASDVENRKTPASGYLLGRTGHDRLPCLGIFLHVPGLSSSTCCSGQFFMENGGPLHCSIDDFLDSRGLSLVHPQPGLWPGSIFTGLYSLAQALDAGGTDRLSDVYATGWTVAGLVISWQGLKKNLFLLTYH